MSVGELNVEHTIILDLNMLNRHFKTQNYRESTILFSKFTKR